MKNAWQLFCTFFKIGAFTLGGGYAMLSMVEKAVVDKKQWIASDEFWASTVPYYYCTYYAHWTPRLGLAAASEWSGAFETDSWCGQGAVSHDGKDALRSGIIYDKQNSYLLTRVTGPGTLTFWWKVSCEAGGNDALRFLLDGAQKYSISGETDWAKVTVYVTGSGTHVLKWNYTKNSSVTKGQDFGWVDQIGWTPAL